MKQPKPTLLSLSRELERANTQLLHRQVEEGNFLNALAKTLGCENRRESILANIGQYVAAYADKRRREAIEDQERSERYLNRRTEAATAAGLSGIDPRSMAGSASLTATEFRARTSRSADGEPLTCKVCLNKV